MNLFGRLCKMFGICLEFIPRDSGNIYGTGVEKVNSVIMEKKKKKTSQVQTSWIHLVLAIIVTINEVEDYWIYFQTYLLISSLI